MGGIESTAACEPGARPMHPLKKTKEADKKLEFESGMHTEPRQYLHMIIDRDTSLEDIVVVRDGFRLGPTQAGNITRRGRTSVGVMTAEMKPKEVCLYVRQIATMKK